jgi:hypothetical protein
MKQLLSVAALLVAAGGLLTIFLVVIVPVVHREVVVFRLRAGLRRIDHVLAGWQHDQNGGRRSPYGGV